MKSNHKGFAPLVVLLMVIALGLVAETGWYVWTVKNASRNTQQTITNDAKADLNTNQTTQPEADVSNPVAIKKTAEENNTCATGRVIVYINPGVSLARQQEIIRAEQASVKSNLDHLNGYILNVTQGQEAEKSQAFTKYPEVKSVAPDGCPEPTNAPDAAD